MKWLVTYAKMGRNDSEWTYGNMVTDLTPAKWIIWAKNDNWAEGTIYHALVVLLNAIPLDKENKETVDELEDMLA